MISVAKRTSAACGLSMACIGSVINYELRYVPDATLPARVRQTGRRFPETGRAGRRSRAIHGSKPADCGWWHFRLFPYYPFRRQMFQLACRGHFISASVFSATSRQGQSVTGGKSAHAQYSTQGSSPNAGETWLVGADPGARGKGRYLAVIVARPGINGRNRDAGDRLRGNVGAAPTN